MKRIYTLTTLLITILMLSCDKFENSSSPHSQPNAKPTVLTLESVTENSIEVRFTPTNKEKLPRIVDIYLTYDPKSVKLGGYEKGDALVAAEKDIFVKADDKTGSIRITSLSAANLNRIQEGVIAKISFTRIDGSKEAVINFDTEKQVFAPAEANEQVTFGKGLTL